MKKLLIFILSISFYITSIFSQGSNYNNTFQFGIQSGYQKWNNIDNKSMSQQSNLFSLSYKLSRYTLIRANGGLAFSNVLSSSLSGISDIQLQLNQKIKRINTSVDFGVSIPSGKESLTQSEFASTILLSRDLFNIKMPVLGQGTNVFFGATWAKDLSDYIIFGLGASYHFRGKYKPLEIQGNEYNPSNELLLTTGVDFRVDRTKTISADVIGIFYGEDEVDNKVVFSAGNRFVCNIIYRQYFNQNIWWIFLRYRYSGTDEIGNETNIINEKINPNHLILSTSFHHFISKMITLNYLLETRIFEKTQMVYSGYVVYSAGLGANLRISKTIQVPVTMRYNLAAKEKSNINGFEIGLGLNFTL